VLRSLHDHLRTRTRDLDYPFLAGANNIDCWCSRKGDLQHDVSLDVPMVPSSSVAVAADGECFTCG
jgi:hypothetical protein